MIYKDLRNTCIIHILWKTALSPCEARAQPVETAYRQNTRFYICISILSGVSSKTHPLSEDDIRTGERNQKGGDHMNRKSGDEEWITLRDTDESELIRQQEDEERQLLEMLDEIPVTA